MPVTPTYVALGTITLASTDAEIVFSSIPATYRDLILIVNSKVTSSATGYFIQFNADTGSNYSYVRALGNGSTASSSSATGTSILIGVHDASVIEQSQTQIMDYSATDKHKTVLARFDLSNSHTNMVAGRWANTSAITSLKVLSSSGLSFAIGSTLSLYGVN